MQTFQELILKLSEFWAREGCVLQQPLDLEVGAGTMHPGYLPARPGPEPWRVAYVQPSRRPADGRYGDNPFRLGKHHQFQVILKPSPLDVQRLYVRSLEAIGLDLTQHDLRFEEDNWEAPTLGAWGVGWQVMLDGMEITQFTYFQQAGGPRAQADQRRDHLRPRAAHHVPLALAEHLRDRLGGGAPLRPGAQAGGVRALPLLLRGRRRRLPAEPVRGLRARGEALPGGRAGAARPTSAPSSARTRSTCSTPAAPSRSPSGWG